MIRTEEIQMELAHFAPKKVTSPGERQTGKTHGSQFKGNCYGSPKICTELVHFTWGSLILKALMVLNSREKSLEVCNFVQKSFTSPGESLMVLSSREISLELQHFARK